LQSNLKTKIEYATSWSRAFAQVFVEIKWLNAFAKINRIACEHTLHRMANIMLEVKDNVIEKKLLFLTSSYKFYNPKEAFQLKNQLFNFYAVHFLKGDVELARQMIEPI